MSEQGATAAGWYPDPGGSGGQRYWDGSAWTDHTAPATAPPPPGAGAGVPPAQRVAMTPTQSRQWASGAHLASFLGAFVAGLAVAGPLIVYLMKKDEDAFVRDQAAEALNFQLSTLLYLVVGGLVGVVVAILTLGLGLLALIPLFLIGLVAWIVLVIVAAVAANRGEAYRYPLTIRFVS